MKFLTLILLLICQASYSGTADQRLHKIEFKKLNLTAELRSMGDITRKDASTFKLELFDSTKSKRTPIKLEKMPKLHLWMVMKGGHGHGSETLKLKIDKNSYIVSNAWFLMMGEWQLKAELVHGKNTEKGIFPICVERKPSDSHVGKCGF